MVSHLTIFLPRKQMSSENKGMTNSSSESSLSSLTSTVSSISSIIMVEDKFSCGGGGGMGILKDQRMYSSQELKNITLNYFCICIQWIVVIHFIIFS